MKSEKQMNEQEQSTEEKILEAASEVFTEKGFAGTRTRDIAEKAGINLALLNYYFRSKEKLPMKISHDGNENPATNVGNCFGVRNCNGQRVCK